MIYIILLIVIVIIYYIFFNLEYFMETNEDEYIIRIPKICNKAKYFRSFCSSNIDRLQDNSNQLILSKLNTLVINMSFI